LEGGGTAGEQHQDGTTAGTTSAAAVDQAPPPPPEHQCQQGEGGEGGAEEEEDKDGTHQTISLEELTRQQQQQQQQQQAQIVGGDDANTNGSATSASVSVSADSESDSSNKHSYRPGSVATASSPTSTAAVAAAAVAVPPAAAAATAAAAPLTTAGGGITHASSSEKEVRQESGTKRLLLLETGDDDAEQTSSSCAVPTAEAEAEAEADTEGATSSSSAQQQQSQRETEGEDDNIDVDVDANDASPTTPIEQMAARSGFNINLSSLPPGAYMVEPAYPPARRQSYTGVLTAEVSLAGEGRGAEETGGGNGGGDGGASSRSSTSMLTNPNFAGSSRTSTSTLTNPNFARGPSRRNSGNTTRTAANTDDDADLHHIVTATCVDEECVVDACPVPEGYENEMILVQAEREEHKHEIATMKKWLRFMLGGAVLALVAIAVALAAVFGGGGGGSGGNNGGNNEGVGTAGAAQVDADRLEALRSIVLPLSGSAAFDPTSPGYSDQRVAALDWLANDRYATERLPTDDPSLAWKIRQRYVMGLFHIMTDSPNWFDNFNSLTDRDECDWNRANSLEGKETEDFFTGVQREVEIKGIICNESGRVKRIILWWNNLSGELPHELSYLSESLVDLNLSGGSMSGPIPDSFGNLTKLGGLALAEHCFTGTVPESLSQLPELNLLILYGNPELGGSLNGLCDGDQFRNSKDYVSADCGDCPGSEALVECDCCTCCDSNTFDCCDKDGKTLWKYINLEANPLSGKPLSFERDCLTEEGALWAQEECPCVDYEPDQQRLGKCTKECSVR